MPNIRILPIQIAVLEAARKYTQTSDAWLKELMAHQESGTGYDPKTGNIAHQVRELWDAKEIAIRDLTMVTRGMIALEEVVAKEK